MELPVEPGARQPGDAVAEEKPSEDVGAKAGVLGQLVERHVEHNAQGHVPVAEEGIDLAEKDQSIVRLVVPPPVAADTWARKQSEQMRRRPTLARCRTSSVFLHRPQFRTGIRLRGPSSRALFMLLHRTHWRDD